MKFYGYNTSVSKDPNGNGIRQWRAVQGVANTGVIELSMPTSSQPPLGDWSIEVTVRVSKLKVDNYPLTFPLFSSLHSLCYVVFVNSSVQMHISYSLTQPP